MRAQRPDAAAADLSGPGDESAPSPRRPWPSGCARPRRTRRWRSGALSIRTIGPRRASRDGASSPSPPPWTATRRLAGPWRFEPTPALGRRRRRCGAGRPPDPRRGAPPRGRPRLRARHRQGRKRLPPHGRVAQRGARRHAVDARHRRTLRGRPAGPRSEHRGRGALSARLWRNCSMATRRWWPPATTPGKRAVIRYGRVPPYPETQRYVPRVLAAREGYR